jgi:hypothetical protein
MFLLNFLLYIAFSCTVQEWADRSVCILKFKWLSIFVSRYLPEIHSKPQAPSMWRLLLPCHDHTARFYIKLSFYICMRPHALCYVHQPFPEYFVWRYPAVLMLSNTCFLDTYTVDIGEGFLNSSWPRPFHSVLSTRGLQGCKELNCSITYQIKSGI